ncbi:hypothetical protein HYS84_00630 [Candidatus Saccharibacteria bacterium]|nr:hypothetical protein [Candidatus Saccharibacteria bacterium]
MRKNKIGNDAAKIAPMYALLSALSDDLSLPLLQIKNSVEALQQVSFARAAARLQAEKINLSADNGLQLIEAYKLVLKAGEMAHEEFEPVAIGAVLQEVAHQLTPYAKKYDTDLLVDVQHRLTPVLAHQPSLSAALQVLSASMIRAQAAQVQQKRYKLLLGAHRSADYAISTGVFSSIHGLSDKTLRSARGLVGKARQPLPAIPAGAASGVLIADMLCSAMWQPLRAAAHGGLHGLATAVPISKQLQFV